LKGFRSPVGPENRESTVEGKLLVARLRESITALGISTRKLTAGSDIYPSAAETRWQNFAAANYSQLCVHACIE
jgi:hypothetical protein